MNPNPFRKVATTGATNFHPLVPRRMAGAVFVAAMAGLLLAGAPADAGTMSAGAAPTVDGFDIANYGAVTGNDKWFSENNTGAGSCKGQSFTTGPAAVELRSVSYQVTATQQAQPTKTYVVRVGTVAGTTFTEIHSETFTQNFAWNGGEFMSWTFDDPPILTGNTTYAVDIGMTGSTSSWTTGIPYINVTANAYPGGVRYSAGQFGVGDSDMHVTSSSDRIFHLDLGIPSGSGLQFVAGNPADDAVDALIAPELVATFNQNLVAGTGDITIRNLTDAVDTVLPVGDSQFSLSDNLLLIETAGLIDWSKSYAIRIEAGALESDTGDIFAGIADDTTWNFTTAAGDPLLLAIEDLKDHLNGVSTLTPAEIGERKLTIDAGKQRFDESASIITAVFDLVTTYDTVVGPLWVSGSPVQGFSRNNANDISDQNIHWVIYTVMQNIMDEVYNAPAIANHEALLDGYKFGSSANFPGAAAPPTGPPATHTATINGSFPDTFGRDTQQWTLPARKPTGTYLAPGTIATVTVPPALVGQGYQVRVGAHSWDLSNRPPVERLERATILYSLDAPTIKVASPYGGGIYIEVPMGADAGVVSVDITGALRSPYFSAKSFHTTTLSEWVNTERNHPAPWADFQSEKFMTQVPRKWIYNHPDPAQMMADWDSAMDAINSLMGFPLNRGKETMYCQTDVILRSSVHAPGYPAVNVTSNVNSEVSPVGYAGNYLVRGPGASPTAANIEFHEQGHAYFFPKFGGETESNVNLLQPAMLQRKFGYSFDVAHAGSLGSSSAARTMDNTAVAWMCVFNFSPREVPMADAEKAYQHKGHAKFLDIARLFGWDGLDTYWRSFMEDDANSISYGTSGDDLLLRLCKSVGTDIRPLFHFWGIHPQNPTTLASAVAAEGLQPPVEIYDALVHYKSLVPANNAAFRTFATAWWGKQPSIGGYWEEREHARQWDTTALYGVGDQQRSEATNPGEIYNENSAADITARVQELLDLYYPDGRPEDDYELWASAWPGADLSDPNADFSGNGLTNNEARIWGLDPTDSTAVNPISAPLDGAGTLSYTRREAALTGLDYKVWYSTDLEVWLEDTGALQEAGGPVDGVETVAVTLSPVLMGETTLFVRIGAQ